MSQRSVIAVTGADRVSFLQGLVTNDVENAGDGLVYTALLTPQGKFIADFFVKRDDDRLLIDVDAEVAPALFQRLSMYRLRADVQLAETDLKVSTGIGPAPDGACVDPRDPAMGWRHYGTGDLSEDVDWPARRVAHLVPQTGLDLTPDTYILEAGFERLNGVDFKKGCFVGQEIVARMKHKTQLRKGLVRVTLDGAAEPGDVIMSDGKEAGQLHTVASGTAIAYVRFDRLGSGLTAGAATLTVWPEDLPD